MKLSSWFLRVTTVAMVALSLVFTWLIWQNPSRLYQQEAATPVTTTDPNADKQINTVFTPTTAYYHHDNIKQWLFAPDAAITTTLCEAMAQWQLGKVGSTTKLNARDYEQLLNADESLQLVYAGSMSYQVFAQHFLTKSGAATTTDFTFNRLVVNLKGDTKHLLFVNDGTKAVHTGTLTKAPQTQLKKRLQAAQKTSFAVVETPLHGRQVPFFTTDIEVQPYVYLLDQQSANHYVPLLMPTQATSNVDTREIGDETVYTFGTDYRLTANTLDKTLQFENSSIATSPKAALSTQLKRAYSVVGRLSLQGLNSMRYTDYVKAKNLIEFRAVAQGLPIFNQDYYGRVEVLTGENSLQMHFSSNNLTVPIPTEQAKVTLPKTQSVVDQLLGAGFHQGDLQDLVLGYAWTTQDENSQVVALTPTYFVKIDGRYRAYTDWLANKDADAA